MFPIRDKKARILGRFTSLLEGLDDLYSCVTPANLTEHFVRVETQGTYIVQVYVYDHVALVVFMDSEVKTYSTEKESDLLIALRDVYSFTANELEKRGRRIPLKIAI